jgi:hygromycin-B 4-O-kinase
MKKFNVLRRIIMPDLRSVVTDRQVYDALSQYFSTPITDLTPIAGGNVAQTFAFRNSGEEYIVRFNDDNMMTANLSKEAYLAPKLAAAGIPVAPILYVGRLGERHFAISRKLPGRMLETFTGQEVKQFLPQMVAILDTIHHSDISDTQGYGVMDDHGVGFAASWRDALSRIADEEDERMHGYYGKWHHLFDDTFLERDLFQNLYQRMQQLLDFVPPGRYLLHGDYNLRNILAQDGKITAVLDWLGAGYGDFVYDIAGLDFWCPWLDVRASFQRYYQERQVALPAYEERLLCYQCYTALVGLIFFAKAGNEDGYQWVRRAILDRLS